MHTLKSDVTRRSISLFHGFAHVCSARRYTEHAAARSFKTRVTHSRSGMEDRATCSFGVFDSSDRSARGVRSGITLGDQYHAERRTWFPSKVLLAKQNADKVTVHSMQ